MKRFLSFLLVVTLLLGLYVLPASAESENGTQYKTVFVHGILGYGYNDGLSRKMNYWGMLSGDMLAYLRAEGYDVIDASVGPLSSDHDRCCELFAQLTGTVTDYGAAHSASVEQSLDAQGSGLKHDRFGRDYSGSAIVENWGPIFEDGKVTGWYDNKINLVAHSMGGPTCCMFLQLLAEGDEAERNWGMEQASLYGGDWHDYVSPLFWGDCGGQYLVHSLTTLAGALNGTSITSCCRDSIGLLMTLIGELASATGSTDIASLYDFQLEHFGITAVPGSSDREFFSSAKVKQFLASGDCAPYDVTVGRTNELKCGWKTYDNIYYFSYAGDCTHGDSRTGCRVPDADMLALLLPFSAKMGGYENAAEPVTDISGNAYSFVDKTWQPNDGVVNTISARYPIGAAQKPYDGESIEAGIWQWRDLRYDHMSFVGGLGDLKLVGRPDEMKSFYGGIMADIAKTAPISKNEVFSDIAGSAYHDGIVKVYELGLVCGYPDGTFRPNEKLTRAQTVTVLYRMAGSPDVSGMTEPFADVPDGFWAQDAIIWAYNVGIVKGFTDTRFAPNEAVTRAQFVTMLYRYAGSPAVKGSLAFTDSTDIASPYVDAVLWASQNGIVEGFPDGSFRPNETAARAQMAVILARSCRM